MTVKNDAKLEEEFACCFKTRALEILKNFHFNELLLRKVYIV